jgi:hypothetical protein
VITRELNKLGIVRTRKRNNAEDFFKSISKNPNNDCWEWNKYINNKGYGTFCINKQHIPSHRYSYEIFIGDPSGFEVCHKCDNPKCVNPSHLFLGTHSDNMRDRSLKGRGNDKLTPQKVIEIRNMYEQGIETSAIAKIYSMNRRSIRSIRTKETWSYVK